MTMARHIVSGRHPAQAFSLAEAVVSIAIVGVMLVAALHTVGAAKLGEQKTGDRGKGMLLAQQLMAEVLQQHYEDPELPTGSFGLSSDEIGDGSRALWEDVDDYDGWAASPPEQKDGTVIPDLEGWTRSVRVDWVDPADLSHVVGSDTRVKRIIVRVTRGDVTVASIVAVRTGAADSVRSGGIGG